MTLNQIEKEVREILIQQINGFVLNDFVDNSEIIKTLGDDVLEFVKALMAVEDRFQIEFGQDTQIESISIEDIVEYVDKHQKRIA